MTRAQQAREKRQAKEAERKLAHAKHTLEDRIQSWKDIAMKCEAKLRTELDPASQAFNSAILKIANLELTQAVRERMNQ